MNLMPFTQGLALATATVLAATGTATADQVINDDLVVSGRACIGVDCANNEPFGAATLRVKDTSPRIEFFDTTTGAFSPTLDWTIRTGFQTETFEIISGGSTVPFSIRGEAPASSMVISFEGDVGLGTSAPQRELHIRDGDTPTLRLDQSGTVGNTPQVWDIGANDANFFVRDQDTQALPFRIRPGAPSNSVYIAGNGEVGMGIPDPGGALHIRRNQPDNVPHLILQTRRADGRVELWMTDQGAPGATDTVKLQMIDDVFNVSYDGTGAAEFQVFKSGDVRVRRGDLIVETGSIRVGGQTLNVPDYVFAPDYDLMPLADVAAFIDAHSHLPHIPSAAEVATDGLDTVAMQMAMLKTIEEQMLHILNQDARLSELTQELSAQRAALDRLNAERGLLKDSSGE